MVIAPRIASKPPATTVAISAICGTAANAGWKRAVSRPTCKRIPKSLRARAIKLVCSRSSWTKALTMRTPVTVSSTWLATSAACCWASHVAS